MKLNYISLKLFCEELYSEVHYLRKIDCLEKTCDGNKSEIEILIICLADH